MSAKTERERDCVRQTTTYIRVELKEGEEDQRRRKERETKGKPWHA